MIPQLQQAPMMVPSLNGPMTRDAQLAWLSQQTDGAVSAQNDPAQWTPEEAADQTDRALARIGTANPELARQLAAQHGKAAEAGEDLPWYKDVLGAVGEVLHATKLDVVFDYMGRAAKIVPEIIHDWGKEDVWKNLGDAVFGRSTISWDDVLVDNFGMERNWLTAALGFVGDVATDPLTYLTFGMGGIGRHAAARVVTEAGVAAALKSGTIGVTRKVVTEGIEGAAKQVMRYGDEAVDLSLLGRELTAAGFKNYDDAARAIVGLTDSGTQLAARGSQGALSRIRASLGHVHPDARSGAAFTLDKLASQDALAQTIRFADDMWRASTTTGWQRVTKEAAAKMGVEKALVDDILKGYVRQGSGAQAGARYFAERGEQVAGKEAAAMSKVLYRQGKAAAAGLGGVRVRFALPGLDLRAAGMQLPFWPKRMDFSMGRRFMAGISGQTRLMKMVGKSEASMEDMRIFWEEGYKGLHRLSPAVAKKVGKGTRSPFYTASEGMGRVTEHFSVHHKQLRGGGLAAKYAGETSVQARHIRTQTIEEVQTVTLPGGKVLTPNQVAQRLGEAVKNAGSDEKAAELADALNELRVTVPVGGTTPEKYWDDRIAAFTLRAKERGEQGTEDFLTQREIMRHDRERAVQAAAKVRELSGDGDLADIWRQVAQNTDDAEINAGLLPDSYNDEAINADDLTVEDALQYSDGETWVSDEITGGNALDESVLTDTGRSGVPVRGVHAYKKGRVDDPAPDVAVVAPDAPDPMDELRAALDDSVSVEQGDTAVAEGQDILDKSRAATGRMTDEEAEAVSRAAGEVIDPRTRKPIDRAGQAARIDDVIASVRAFIPLGDSKTDDALAKLANQAEAGLIAEADIIPFLERQGLMTPELKAHIANAVEMAEEATPVEAMVTNPTLVVIGNMSDDARKSMLANLDELTPEQKAFRMQPTVVATGPRRTLRIDRSTPQPGVKRAADEVNDPIAEIHDTYRPILDDMEQGKFPNPEDLDEDTAAALQEVVASVAGKDAQLADITTILLKERGYSEVVIKTDEGEELISFWDAGKGTVPVSRVNPNAARLTDHGGSQLRGVTDEATEAIRGTDRRVGDRIIARILRETKHSKRADAEKAAQQILAQEGKALRPGQRFFETNPLNILEQASHETAKRVQTQFVGEAIRHAENLGLTRGGYGAQGVGLGRYTVVLNEGGKAWAKTASDDIKAAQEEVSRLSDRAIPDMEAHAQDLADQYLAASGALAELKEYGSARTQAILTDIGHQTDEALADQFDPEVVTRNMAQRHADFNALANRTEALPEGQVFRKVKDLAEGASIHVHQKGLKHVYYYVDESGRVLGFREVKLPGPEWAAAKGYAADEAQLYGSVSAMTATAAQGQGVGKALLRAHWDEVGVTTGTADEQFTKMAKAISVQDLSPSGAALNASAVKKRSQELLKQARSRANVVKQEVDKTSRDLDRAQTTMQEATNELNRLRTRTQTDRAPVLAALRPKEDGLNLTGMDTLDLPGFEEFSMPKFMADEFRHAMRGFPKLDGAHLAFRQFNNWWKQFATWLIPGFHLRNVQGAFFNNFLGGVQLKDYITSSRIRYAERELSKGKPAKWAKRLVSEADGDLTAALRFAEPTGFIQGIPIEKLTYADLANLTAGMNLTASNGRVFAEAMLTAEEEARRVAKSAKGKKGYIRRIPQPYVKAMRGSGTMTENVFRTAAFTRGLREGRSIMESRAYTMMRHGDYEDLTDTEFMWVRDLIPFYKWMRTNTPFQVHQLLENPARLMAVKKAQEGVFGAQGLDYEKEKHRMPDWMAEGFVIPFNKGETEEGLTTFESVMLDLPMSDLFIGGREFMASFLPTVRPFLESYITHQQTFTGAPLEGKQVPVNPLFGPLLPVLDAVGLVSTGKDGKRYMSDRTQNLLGAIPLFTRFKNFIYEDEGSVSKRSNAVASAMFGFQLRPVDEQALTASEFSFYYDQVLPTVEYLRGVGYDLPTTDELSQVAGTTDSILAKLGITPGPTGAVAA